MAIEFSRIVERLRDFAPELKGQVLHELSSSTDNHRLDIRKSIREHLDLHADHHDQLENLAKPPSLDGWSLSISHCKEAGGWAAIPGRQRIGLDLEVRDRIHKQIVERISQPGELNMIPDASFLWCAKEAYFKALAKDQPVAVSQLYIDKWEPCGDGSFTFSGLGEPPGRGILITSGCLLVSICIV